MVIVFLEAGLDRQTTVQQRHARHKALTECAARAGLAGDVVAVWQDWYGRTKFIAPPQQHSFFRVVNYDQLYAQVNCRLNCDVT